MSLALGASAAVPVTLETIPARQIAVDGTGCFQEVSGGVIDISRAVYDSFAAPSAPSVRAWCGTKFLTTTRQPKKGDYWMKGGEEYVVTKVKPIKLLDNVYGVTLDKAKNEIKITEPLIKILTPKVLATIITYQASDNSSNSDVTSLTTAFDVGAGTNRLLHVDVETYDADGVTDCVVSGITFNAIALTKATSTVGISGTNNMSESWYLIAPATGSHNVVTSVAGTCSFLTHSFIALNGAHQSSQPDALGGGTCSTTLTTDICTASITTATKNAWTVSAVALETCGDTNVRNASLRSDSGCYADATGDASPATAATHLWTDGAASERWVYSAVAYKPDVTDTVWITDVYARPGYFEWTAPTGVTTAYVSCWGGGGGGGDGTNTGGGGGGGGAYASSSVVVTPGTRYTLYIGPGGHKASSAAGRGFDGATTTFATTTVVSAPGWGGFGGSAANANGGLGGATASSTGTTKYAGGNGGRSTNTGDTGGGGGGAGGPDGAGAAGSNGGSGTTGGDGGTGDNTLGGPGGTGGNTASGVQGGQNPKGGGGGGGGDDTFSGGDGGQNGAGGGGGEGNSAGNTGDGADGRCEINYQMPTASAGGAPLEDVIWFW